MQFEKQVDKDHYKFDTYMDKSRWVSVWHQLDEVMKLRPNNVLEIGPGPGLFKTVAGLFGINVETLDLDPDLKPDYVASAIAMPFANSTYDVVCAFQMLEHLPYETSLLAFDEMVRVSRSNVVISLPDSRAVWRYVVHVPKLGDQYLLIPRPQIISPKHVFNGEHYWEVNKRGYTLDKIVNDLSSKIRMTNTYRVSENPYHRFFIFEK